MIMFGLIAAMAMSASPAPSRLPIDLDLQAGRAAAMAGDKNPRKFTEQIQQVQYDGEYSPPAGRQPEPAPSPTTPVHYLPPYMRDIPVIVQPAPIYVTEQQLQAQAQQKSQQAQAQAQAQTQQSAFASSPGLTTSQPISTPGALPSAGSATGSTAIATYGTLPAATPVKDAGMAADETDTTGK